jgi:rhamnosyltransferase
MGVVAVIVSHDPELDRFRLVLDRVSGQVGRVIIVDNDSRSKDALRGLCGGFGNCDFIEIGFNSGVAHALRVGVNYASKYKPDWLLFLDDDTVPMDNAVGKVLGLINNLPRHVLDRVGAVLMGSVDGDCSIGEVRYGVFSGTLVRADVAVRVCCRDDFFLDQADHDMYSRIRELGYITLGINCRLVDHRLGTMRWVPIISNIFHRSVNYEPPWRYYYIIRNSTRLLLEGKMDFAFYMRQLINWGVRILLADGPWKLIKPLGLGIIHAILNELGYVESRVFTQCI